MPPQPLYKVEPNADVRFSPTCFARHPILAGLAMRVVDHWALIDSFYTHIAAAFLKADYEVVSAMLDKLNSAEAKRDVISAAAEQGLTEADYRLFRAVDAVLRPIRNRRNEFAHHVWGDSVDIPNALLLADPKVLAKPIWDMKIRSRDNPIMFPTVPKPDASRIFVYREQDLREEVDRAGFATIQVFRLQSLCADRLHGLGSARHELLSEPLIRQRYQKLEEQERPAPPP